MELYNMYYTREYIIWFLFNLFNVALDRASAPLVSKVELSVCGRGEKKSYICSKIGIIFDLLTVSVTACNLYHSKTQNLSPFGEIKRKIWNMLLFDSDKSLPFKVTGDSYFHLILSKDPLLPLFQHQADF